MIKSSRQILTFSLQVTSGESSLVSDLALFVWEVHLVNKNTVAQSRAPRSIDNILESSKTLLSSCDRIVLISRDLAFRHKLTPSGQYRQNLSACFKTLQISISSYSLRKPSTMLELPSWGPQLIGWVFVFFFIFWPVIVISEYLV